MVPAFALPELSRRISNACAKSTAETCHMPNARDDVLGLRGCRVAASRFVFGLASYVEQAVVSFQKADGPVYSLQFTTDGKYRQIRVQVASNSRRSPLYIS